LINWQEKVVAVVMQGLKLNVRLSFDREMSQTTTGGLERSQKKMFFLFLWINQTADFKTVPQKG
jgi:hypothetical protein